MDDSKITASAAPLNIGGEEYRASPLTDKDHSELDLWCQAQIVRIARAACEGLERTEEKDLMRMAFIEAATIRWTTDIGSKMFESRNGMAKLAWQLIHKNHPNVEMEEIRAKLEPKDLGTIMDAFSMLHTPNEKDVKESEETGKN